MNSQPDTKTSGQRTETDTSLMIAGCQNVKRGLDHWSWRIWSSAWDSGDSGGTNSCGKNQEGVSPTQLPAELRSAHSWCAVRTVWDAKDWTRVIACKANVLLSTVAPVPYSLFWRVERKDGERGSRNQCMLIMEIEYRKGYKVEGESPLTPLPHSNNSDLVCLPRRIFCPCIWNSAAFW